jgi:hypothetical protein
VLATQLRRLIHELVRKLGPHIDLHVRVVILGLSGPLSSSRHSVHFAAGSTPFDPFGELDAMDILKVEFHLQYGWEGVDAFSSRMCAFSRFATVKHLDVSVNMCFPFFSVEELLHPRGSWKSYISQAERAISRAGEGSAIDERIALDGKRFRPPQVDFTVIVLFILAHNPLTAVEAQLGKAVAIHEFLFIAAVYVPPSLGCRFAIGKESR